MRARRSGWLSRLGPGVARTVSFGAGLIAGAALVGAVRRAGRPAGAAQAR